MSMLNKEFGKYEASFSISVSGVNHKACIDTYNRFKHLIKALDWGDIAIHESKDARKGPVLKREINITYTAFPDDIIAFREILDRTIFKINLFGEGLYSAVLNRCTVLRCDRFSDFFD